MITHDLDLAARADRILDIQDGKLGESGTHQELLAKGGLYAALWRMHRQAMQPENDDARSA